MSYSKIFKDKTWSISQGLEELAESQHPLESLDLLEILHHHLMDSISKMEDKNLQAEMIGVLPNYYNLLTTFHKSFLFSYLKSSQSR